jgi:methylenetetrahydrofolate dehydrogenase (NADP+) / methenyltetrahydrofolate cyclohydrolase
MIQNSTAIIFDGLAAASVRERALTQRVTELSSQGVLLKIVAILFAEDAGSQLYTRLKREAAERVGIAYEVVTHSMLDEISVVQRSIAAANNDPTVTGIIIQKPWRQRWTAVTGRPNEEYNQWWHQLVSNLDLHKDVDGLQPDTLAALQDGTWREKGLVLPATARAVLSILEHAPVDHWQAAKVIILGKSDLLGIPLAAALKHQGVNVELLGRKELAGRLAAGQALRDAQVVISATGQPHLVTGEMLSPGAVVIDVGEPKPDIDKDSVATVASFLTPVPGGVGPLTVVSLLENAVQLATRE